MTQGIREFTNANFATTLPKLQSGEIKPAEFRREVMDLAVVAFGISVASAATHYNHALKQARLEDPKSVKSLGRPEDKKGGRKAVTTFDVIKVKTGEVIVSGVSKGAADTLIATAVAKGKAKLAIKTIEIAPAVEVATEAVTA